MKRILAVFGTRPEAIKMSPLIKELKKRGIFDVKVALTGQHADMLYDALSAFGINADFDLEIMKIGQTPSDVTAEILTGIREIYKEAMPDIVLVHGDTATAFAAALSAFYMKIPVGHIEAGLRTYDINTPHPEELHRRAVALIASLHFAPTEAAEENLLREGVSKKRIFVTGNTAIDALKMTLDGAADSENHGRGKRIILLTAHRRESIGPPMEAIFRAVKRICLDFCDIRVIFPMHKNPAVREIARRELAGVSRLYIVPPIPAKKFHTLMKKSYMILTDSGGIQEEAAFLGKPTLVMRERSERSEIAGLDSVRLVGCSENGIYTAAARLLTDAEHYERACRPSLVFGDGYASCRIADVLEKLNLDKKC